MRSARDVSGFRARHMVIAERIKPGDLLICYMTRLSRWFGVLEVVQGPFKDDTPIFVPDSDPFVVRFRVHPIVLLDPETAVPIRDSEVWNHLSFTRDLEPGSISWTGKVRSSLVKLDDVDGNILLNVLKAQSTKSGHILWMMQNVAFWQHTLSRGQIRSLQ